jgi:hypothetical protein
MWKIGGNDVDGNELQSMWKKVTVGYFKVPSQY